jgi:hypothetical protein
LGFFRIHIPAFGFSPDEKSGATASIGAILKSFGFFLTFGFELHGIVIKTEIY